MIMFHGGCNGCTQQDINGVDFCINCCYFQADWNLPDLSNLPMSEADRVREELKRKHNM